MSKANTFVVDMGGAPSDSEIMKVLSEIFPEHDVVEGTVVACKECGFFDCVCEVRKSHAESCRFCRAMEMPFGIGCDEHDRDVCPECDPCTCKEKP